MPIIHQKRPWAELESIEVIQQLNKHADVGRTWAELVKDTALTIEHLMNPISSKEAIQILKLLAKLKATAHHKDIQDLLNGISCQF